MQPTFNNSQKHGKTKSNNNSTLYNRDLFRLSNNGPNQQKQRQNQSKNKAKNPRKLGSSQPPVPGPLPSQYLSRAGEFKSTDQKLSSRTQRANKKKAKRQSREGKKNGGATISCLQKKNPKDSGATPGNKRKQPPRHRLRRCPPLHR